jgi:hypothetical protein
MIPESEGFFERLYTGRFKISSDILVGFLDRIVKREIIIRNNKKAIMIRKFIDFIFFIVVNIFKALNQHIYMWMIDLFAKIITIVKGIKSSLKIRQYGTK